MFRSKQAFFFCDAKFPPLGSRWLCVLGKVACFGFWLEQWAMQQPVRISFVHTCEHCQLNGLMHFWLLSDEFLFRLRRRHVSIAYSGIRCGASWATGKFRLCLGPVPAGTSHKRRMAVSETSISKHVQAFACSLALQTWSFGLAE